MMFSLTEIRETSSTNHIVKKAIEDGAPEGMAIRAEVQTGGYGRYGRYWKSPSGGMYLSLLLRPEQHADDRAHRMTIMQKLPTLSLLVGLTVRRVVASMIEEASGKESALYKPDNIKIKWPNDVVVDTCCEDDSAVMYRKLGGISLESLKGGVCIGIGINVLRPAQITSNLDSDSLGGLEDKRNFPVYLEDMVGCSAADPGRLARQVLSEMELAYLKWLSLPFSYFMDEYNSYSILAGRPVEISRQDGAVEIFGIARGIDAHGNLLVSPVGTDEVLCISSGEAHVSLG